MKKLYIITLLFIFGAASQGFCQIDTKEVLNKVMKFYKNTPSYQIEATYKMLRGLTGNNSTETYTGVMTKQGDYNRFSVLNSEVIQSSKFRLTLDHDSKTMVYANQDNPGINSSPLDISKFLDFFEASKVSEEGGVLVCELISSKRNQQMPYGKIALYIDKATSQVKKQVFYFSTLIPFKEGNTTKMDYGRLVVELKHKKAISNTFNMQDYVHFSNNNKVEVTEKFQQYKLINQVN
ncbi:hypothetical protein [Aquimarina sp. MMG016]|uniref:LolA family protein n=1 Tax=Aquimarina sp. MMG016 TaxID=2822690 RepID=UPI001B39D89B|nr:hypothetical protein [Aquimarina sp. MMG016]MBQ4821406.1 hypothetical protein [Aquimarina sp. MMG016]